MDSKEQEYTRLIKDYKETIYTVCLMNSADQDEAKDLMQEALIQLWRSFGTFRGESDVRTWIYRICMNACISFMRKEEKHKDTLHVDVSDMLKMDDDDSRQIQALHDRIHRLKFMDRAIVLLWMEDLSYEEIGAIIGLTAKNVGVRLVRIKEQLREMSNPKQ